MPRRFERHRRSRSGWDSWDGAPSRSAEVRSAVAADPDPAKRPPGRKDTRRWCKGKVGVEHVRVLERTADPVTGTPNACKWRVDWHQEVAWSCGHREICAGCGKVFRGPWDLAKDGCPDYPGSLEQRHYAEEEAARSRERVTAWRSRKPVITGPQGYRRRR